MKSIDQSILVLYSPQQMFDIVSEVARYHEFLPWCHYSAQEALSDGRLRASIGMRIAGWTNIFTTHNEHLTLANGEMLIRMNLVDGPFSNLQGTWSFIPIPGSDFPACRAQLQLTYEIKNALLNMTVGKAFEKIAHSLIEAFVARAKKIYA